jgi:ABC-2 type transport system permease protein
VAPGPRRLGRRPAVRLSAANTLLGPALDWPSWVLNLSPFTHVSLVPADPWAATSGLVMLGLGAALVAIGMAAFHRRDITGA